jgi:hypothetical protein
LTVHQIYVTLIQEAGLKGLVVVEWVERQFMLVVMLDMLKMVVVVVVVAMELQIEEVVEVAAMVGQAPGMVAMVALDSAELSGLNNRKIKCNTH